GLRVHGDVQGKGLSRALRRGAGTGVSQVVGGDPRDPAAASRSLGGPYRCDCVNTTPSGAPARQPLDVLNYKSDIHIALLTGCGCQDPKVDGVPRRGTKAVGACTV